MVRIQAGLAESRILCLADEFCFCFLNCHADFLIDSLLSDIVARNSNRIHGSNLHTNLATYSGIHAFKVEANDSGKLIVEVVVGSHTCSLDPFVISKFHLLAGLANFISDEFSNCASVEAEILEFVKALSLGSESCVKNSLCESAE